MHSGAGDCNKNTCPTGVATQKPELMKGLVIEDKKTRVANFHKNTVESFVELMGASGIDKPEKNKSHPCVQACVHDLVKNYEEIFPTIPEGSLLEGGDAPFDYEEYLKHASAEEFEIA